MVTKHKIYPSMILGKVQDITLLFRRTTTSIGRFLSASTDTVLIRMLVV